MQTRLGERWPILLAVAAVVFPVGLATTCVRPAAAVLQPAFAWCVRPTIIGRILDGQRAVAKTWVCRGDGNMRETMRSNTLEA